MSKQDELIERARASAAAQARRAGQSAADVAFAVTEAEQIHRNPGLRAYLADMALRQAERQEAEKERAAQLEKQESERFYETLAQRYQDKLEFYRHQGVPEEIFAQQIWPGLVQQFVAEGKDAVDVERERRATSPY